MTESRRLGDRYELGEMLGRGGMAEVLEGQDLRLGRRVAVKILRPDLAQDPSFQARFRREAQSAASLNHPNIVAVYDTGEDRLEQNGETTIVPYIVMEYVDGQTLRELMASGRRLLPERALEITAGTLAALDYSHRHGIVHRDIKPANVMLTRSGDVKVMDFGIARALADATSTMTQASAVMGTAQYLSPEQARGEVVDARSDLYSTGCVLFELLAGQPPFTGDSPVAIAYQHVSEDPPAPSTIDSSVPPSLDALVLKSLAKDPNERYQSASDFRGDVERALAGMPITAKVPTSAIAAGATVGAAATSQLPPVAGAPLIEQEETDGRSPWFWIGIAALVLVVGGLAVLLGRSLFGAVEQVPVPNVVNQTLVEAEQTLRDAQLVLGSQTLQASDRPEGSILNQDPAGGSQAPKGSAVNVVVSAGPEQVSVPNLVGLTSADEARQVLQNAKLNLGTVTPGDSDQPEGVVTGQNPASGRTVDAGTSVNITVSNGSVSVPDVLGQTEAQARSMLTNAGFNVQRITQESEDPAGTVIGQSPSGGASAPRGSTVTITVAIAPTPTPTPTPTESENPPQQQEPPVPNQNGVPDATPNNGQALATRLT